MALLILFAILIFRCGKFAFNVENCDFSTRLISKYVTIKNYLLDNIVEYNYATMKLRFKVERVMKNFLTMKKHIEKSICIKYAKIVQ